MIKIYNKLVRDKIPAIIEENGQKANYRVLSKEEYKQALKDKLLEEVYEFLAAETEDEKIEELADIKQVITAIAKAYKINVHVINNARYKKQDTKGGFYNRYFLESVAEKDSQ